MVTEQHLSHAAIVVVGGANMDVEARSHLELVAQDSNPGSVQFSPGGVGRNIAENLARLGQPTRLVSVVGADLPGQWLLRHTAQAGVDVSCVQALDGWRTATYVSLQGPDGDMRAAVNDMDVLRALTPRRLLAHTRALERASSLVLECNLEQATLDWLLEHYGHLPTSVDGVSAAKCPRIRCHLARLDVLKLNRLEAQLLTGLAVASTAQVCAAAQHLCGQGVRFVIISMGPQGLVWCETGCPPQWVPARRVPLVVSTTGAGDALLAGLIDARARGCSGADAVAWGMACAELTLGVTSANASHLSAASVAAHIANQMQNI